MIQETDAPPLTYTKLIYETVVREKSATLRARQILVSALLTAIVAVSALIAAGWLVLAVSGIGVSLSYGVLGACGLHLLVIGLALVGAAAQILVHTFAKSRLEEFEDHWSAIHQAAIAAPETVRSRYDRLVAATPLIEEKWRQKMRLVNSAAWILGGLTAALFVISLAADIYIGANLEYSDACEDANYTANVPAAPPRPFVQINSALLYKEKELLLQVLAHGPGQRAIPHVTRAVTARSNFPLRANLSSASMAAASNSAA